MNKIRNIANGIFSHWALVLYNMVVSFFLSPFIVNTLGDLYFGLWVTLMQFTSYMYLLDFGLRNTIVHRTAQAVGGRKTSTLVPAIKASMRLSTAIAFLTVIVAIILSFLVPPLLNLDPSAESDARWVILISGITISITIWNNPNEGVIRGFGLFLLANSFGFFTLTIRTALTVTLLLLGYKIISLALAQLFVSIIHVIFIKYVAQHYLKKRGFRKSKFRLSLYRFKALATSVWKYSWSILVDNISQKVIFTSDTIIISMILSVPLVTFYAIANQLIEYLRRLIDSSMAVIMPIASEITGAHREGDLISLLIQSTRFSAWFSLPVLTMYVVMGDTFVGLWMGPNYAEPVKEILTILAITHIIAIQHYGIIIVLRSLEKHRVVAPLRIIEAIVNVVLSVILAKTMGLIGVAFGTAISHVLVTAIILPYIITKELKISYLDFIVPSYLKTLITCGLIAAIGYWIDIEYHPANMAMFFLNISLIILIYLVFSYIFVLNQTERDRVSTRIKAKLASI
ncbi:MAG: oligosaccharide flippase family protein [Gammaproteobacteria bacterium]|nr:oligosaccharide flippase family protein [Gammaproteobacteria bacterium]